MPTIILSKPHPFPRVGFFVILKEKREQINLIEKYHKYFLGIAIVMSSIAISIRGSDGQVELVLQDYPVIIALLVTISLFLIAVYFHFNNKKILSLSNEIKNQSSKKGEEFDTLLGSLTERQREVYDLIISGKTNKEIISLLFIEQSTLKTHINQIYKKLNIKSRKELKSLPKP